MWRRLACMLSNLSWDSSWDERNLKLNLPEKGNVLPNQKTHVVCVYFPTFILHTLILSDRDWNSFDRKDKIFKVKQQSWSGWMHFPQRPVNNRQNSLNSTIYHVQMQIRGAAAGALLQVWLVDIGCECVRADSSTHRFAVEAKFCVFRTVPTPV